MGNIFSKRQKYKLEIKNDRLQLENESQNIKLKSVTTDIEQFISDAEVLQRLGGNESNNLELYLNDVYEKECVLKASEEEVEFIQTGIETLVQKIVDLVMDDFLFNNSKTAFDFIGSEHVIEAYFNINLTDGFSQVKTARSEIIKVGSFYEGTKNNFPDEFDFIYLLFHLRYDIYLFEDTLDCSIRNVTQNLNFKQSLMFISDEHSTVTRKLYFDQYLQLHGPAYMLRFIYINSRGDKRNIHVDLVPAFRITSYDMKHNLDYMFTRCRKFPKYFVKEILSKESCLCILHKGSSDGYRYTFTETEVHFMRNMLSEKHRKVYRILKFLINGHGDGEILKLVFRGWHISSYSIKLRMIEHHDKCQNSDTDNIRGCVINILDRIITFWIEYDFFSKNLLNQIIIKLILRIQQAIKSVYSYDQVRMKSVSRQCLDGIKRDFKGFDILFRYLDTLGEDDPSMDSFEHFLDADLPGWRGKVQFMSLIEQFKPK